MKVGAYEISVYNHGLYWLDGKRLKRQWEREDTIRDEDKTAILRAGEIEMLRQQILSLDEQITQTELQAGGASERHMVLNLHVTLEKLSKRREQYAARLEQLTAENTSPNL